MVIYVIPNELVFCFGNKFLAFPCEFEWQYGNHAIARAGNGRFTPKKSGFVQKNKVILDCLIVPRRDDNRFYVCPSRFLLENKQQLTNQFWIASHDITLSSGFPFVWQALARADFAATAPNLLVYARSISAGNGLSVVAFVCDGDSDG